MGKFTFGYLRDQLAAVKDRGYATFGLHDYVLAKQEGTLPGKLAVLRVDVDVHARRCEQLCEEFARVGVRATFFFRLHAPHYNLFDFENYRVLKTVQNAGHEIGLHTELIDQQVIWNEDPDACLRRDIEVLSQMTGHRIFGTAAHRDVTGNNNLDFWKNRSPEDFGLRYEAYDDRPAFGLFHRSRYVSDSEWSQWKAYENSKLIKDDRRSPAEHAKESVPCLYILIHSDTYYRRHVYE